MRICESLFAALSLGLGQGRPICNELTSCLCAGGHSRHLESVQTPAWPLQLSLRLPLCGLCVPFPSHPSPAHCPPAAPSSTCRTPTDFPAFALAVLPTQDGLQFIPVHCSDLCSNTTSSLKQFLIFLVPAKVPPAPICLGSSFFVQSWVLVEIFQGLRGAKRRNNH